MSQDRNIASTAKTRWQPSESPTLPYTASKNRLCSEPGCATDHPALSEDWEGSLFGWRH